MTPGFWRLVLKNWRGILVHWDWPVALATGLVVTFLSDECQLREHYREALLAEVGVAAGLLGIVLAGLALVVAFLDDDLIVFLHETGDGLAEDVFPFSFTALLAAGTALAGVGFALATPPGDIGWIRAATLVTWFLFGWTLLGVVSLVRLVYQYGTVRVTHIVTSRTEDE